MPANLNHTGEQLDAAIAAVLGGYTDISACDATPADVRAGKKFVGAAAVRQEGTIPDSTLNVGVMVTNPYVSDSQTDSAVQIVVDATLDHAGFLSSGKQVTVTKYIKTQQRTIEANGNYAAYGGLFSEVTVKVPQPTAFRPDVEIVRKSYVRVSPGDNGGFVNSYTIQSEGIVRTVQNTSVPVEYNLNEFPWETVGVHTVLIYVNGYGLKQGPSVVVNYDDTQKVAVIVNSGAGLLTRGAPTETEDSLFGESAAGIGIGDGTDTGAGQGVTSETNTKFGFGNNAEGKTARDKTDGIVDSGIAFSKFAKAGSTSDFVLPDNDAKIALGADADDTTGADNKMIELDTGIAFDEDDAGEVYRPIPAGVPLRFDNIDSIVTSFGSNTTPYGKFWKGTMYYSTDGDEWTVWDGSTLYAGPEKVLMFIGTGNTRVTGMDGKTYMNKWELTGTGIEVSGNLASIVDYEAVLDGNVPDHETYAFYGMFRNNTDLVASDRLAIPWVTIKTYACFQMFHSCGISTPPLMPKLMQINGNGCEEMFMNCAALTAPSSMPRLGYILSYGCKGMYYGCTSLVKLPELKAIYVESGGLNSMFYGCSLIKISKTQVDEYIYLYRVPPTGSTAQIATGYSTFSGTGGTYTGTLQGKFDFYTSNIIV